MPDARPLMSLIVSAPAAAVILAVDFNAGHHVLHPLLFLGGKRSISFGEGDLRTVLLQVASRRPSR